MSVAYGICFIISLGIILFMAEKNYENVNIQQWSAVILFPIIIGAFFLTTIVTSPQAMYVLYCFIYLDSTVLLTILLFTILHTIKVDIKHWAKAIAYGVAFAHLLMIIVNINTGLYYKEITVVEYEFSNFADLVNGPLKIIHYIYLALMFLALITIIIIGFLRKGTYSLRALMGNTIVVLAIFVVYTAELVLELDYSPLPFVYITADLVMAISYNYIRAHEIASVIANQQSSNNVKGYMALSLKQRFLGCNEECKEFIPTLNTQRIDEKLPADSDLRNGIEHFIEAFEKGERNSARFTVGDRIWICDISYFSVRKDGKNQGYLFELRDATEEEKTYEILQSYNETLNAEVKAKSEEIKDIQRKVLVGMANMIENRDSNTGGHVKRTSDVVKILIEEINRQGKIAIAEQEAVDIVRSAPMHDLGKITIDSYILCKPGKLTDDEFAIMKTHATKSGEIVKILLEGVEEERFVNTCYNVARFHHEKWNGSGYPEGLKGEEIPIGARIMAVADVYDALVSKRCYKEPMSFEKATEIMLDGMGKMFDPAMEPVFLACKEKLEKYYSE